MPNPIAKLVQFNEIMLGLTVVQAWIDVAREEHATNQLVQLELDRQQSEIDNRRKTIELAMRDIACRN